MHIRKTVAGGGRELKSKKGRTGECFILNYGLSSPFINKEGARQNLFHARGIDRPIKQNKNPAPNIQTISGEAFYIACLIEKVNFLARTAI